MVGVGFQVELGPKDHLGPSCACTTPELSRCGLIDDLLVKLSKHRTGNGFAEGVAFRYWSTVHHLSLSQVSDLSFVEGAQGGSCPCSKEVPG